MPDPAHVFLLVSPGGRTALCDPTDFRELAWPTSVAAKYFRMCMGEIGTGPLRVARVEWRDTYRLMPGIAKAEGRTS